MTLLPSQSRYSAPSACRGTLWCMSFCLPRRAFQETLDRSWRRTMRTLIALSAVPLLAACGGGGQVISAGDVTVLVSEETGSGMEALGGGQLEVVGGCLGASGSVIVWPHGTEVAHDEPLTVDVPGYGTYGLGDEVQVAGGGVGLERSSTDVEPGPYDVAGVTVPARCAQHNIFLAN